MELPNREKETRPWGSFDRFTLNEPTTVKILTVKAGEAFSLQTHKERDEFWRVLSGTGKIRVGDAMYDVTEGDELFCPKGVLHQAEGGEGGLTFLEIAFGTFDEQDIERVSDRYGRT